MNVRKLFQRSTPERQLLPHEKGKYGKPEDYRLPIPMTELKTQRTNELDSGK